MYSENEQTLKDEWVAEMRQEWMDILVGMWDAVGKVPGEKQLKQYARQLRIIPLGLLEQTCQRAVRDNGVYNTVPTIGAVWEALKKELDINGKGISVDDAIEAWADRRWRSCVIRVERSMDHV